MKNLKNINWVDFTFDAIMIATPIVLTILGVCHINSIN